MHTLCKFKNYSTNQQLSESIRGLTLRSTFSSKYILPHTRKSSSGFVWIPRYRAKKNRNVCKSIGYISNHNVMRSKKKDKQNEPALIFPRHIMHK